MSPRAAWRLEQLGFTNVYDYVAGKADWLAAGLPTEGPASTTLRAGTVVRRNVATSRPEETIGRVRERVAGRDWDGCVVVNATGVVLGVILPDDVAGSDDIGVESVMHLGPPTVRASEDLRDLVTRLREHHRESILVSDPDGRLIGVLVTRDGERALGEAIR